MERTAAIPGPQQHADRRRQHVEQLRRRRDAIAQLRGRPEVDRLDDHPDALLDHPAEPLGLVGPDHGRAGEHDLPEAAAAETIFVIHRGLVDEVGKIADAAGAPVPEEDHVIVADHRQGRVVGAMFTSSQSPLSARSASTALTWLKLAMSTRPACTPAASQTRS